MKKIKESRLVKYPVYTIFLCTSAALMIAYPFGLFEGNLILSILFILIGVDLIVSLLPATRKYMYPELHNGEASNDHKYLVFFTGLCLFASGAFSIFVRPLFN